MARALLVPLLLACTRPTASAAPFAQDLIIHDHDSLPSSNLPKLSDRGLQAHHSSHVPDLQVHEPGCLLQVRAGRIYQLAALCRTQTSTSECTSTCESTALATFNDTRPISFTRVPKCGGATFQIEFKIRYCGGPSGSYWACKDKGDRGFQDCYNAIIADGYGHRNFDRMSAVLLRSPRQHVRDQFGVCTYDGWGQKITLGTDFPRTGDVEADYATWLQHFDRPGLPPGVNSDYKCMDPRDMQTRHLSCTSAPEPVDNHAQYTPPCLETALFNLKDADFVGITDFYCESASLFHIRRTGQVPEVECACDNGASADSGKSAIESPTQRSKGSRTPPHATHGVPANFSATQVSEELLELVDRHTRLDAQLFAAALKRFRSDIATAERLTGQRILCGSRAAKADALAAEYEHVNQKFTG